MSFFSHGKKELLGFVAKSPAMAPVSDFLSKQSKTNLPIIIEGEAGTGKEFAARFLHYNSPRREAPFSTLSLTSLPPEHVFNELFSVTTGKFQGTRGGSLVLKELWAMPKKDQKRLLEILADDRWKDKTPLEVWDVRLIMTSSMSLEKSVESKFVDPELKKVLQQNRVLIPPLRRRPSDIGGLCELFLERMTNDLGRANPRMDARVVDRLTEYDWPGNIKELKDIVRRIVVQVTENRITEHHLKGILPMVEDDIPVDRYSLEELMRAKLGTFLKRIRGYHVEGLYSEVMSRVETPLLELVLEETGGNQLKAAKILGINRNTLRKKVRKKSIRVR